MSKLEVYSSVREQEEYFNVEIINDIGSLKEYIGKEKSQKDVVLYRGVNDGSYKMYSSLQRLWVGCDEKNESLSYEDFLNLIWEKSEYLRGGFFKQHYNDSQSSVTYNGESLLMDKVLIKKSLLPCIERYLCCEFAEDGLEAIYKKLVPVRINCKDYITELLTGEIG